jgi:hypothetical protein
VSGRHSRTHTITRGAEEKEDSVPSHVAAMEGDPDGEIPEINIGDANQAFVMA